MLLRKLRLWVYSTVQTVQFIRLVVLDINRSVSPKYHKRDGSFSQISRCWCDVLKTPASRTTWTTSQALIRKTTK